MRVKYPSKRPSKTVEKANREVKPKKVKGTGSTKRGWYFTHLRKERTFIKVVVKSLNFLDPSVDMRNRTTVRLLRRILYHDMPIIFNRLRYEPDRVQIRVVCNRIYSLLWVSKVKSVCPGPLSWKGISERIGYKEDLVLPLLPFFLSEVRS